MGSLNGLMRFLVDNIALTGERGLEIGELQEYVTQFYRIRCRDTNNTMVAKSDSRLPETMDRAFHERVWTWLTRNPHVCVGINREGNSLSLPDIEDLNARRSIHTTIAPLEASIDLSRTSELRLHTSLDQTWIAVAGHPPDSKKIPPKDFECLLVIASKRKQGILQPDLVKITGQDKRSVPSRTRRLCDRGYIQKIPVLASSNTTSLLVLTKFADSYQGNRRDSIDRTSETNADNIQSPSHYFGYTKYAQVESEIRHAIDTAKEEKIILWNDLKRKAGVFENSHKSKLLAEAFRILEGIGIVQRVRAKIENAKKPDGLHRCVKLLREPEELDWSLLFQTVNDQYKKSSLSAEEGGTDRGLPSMKLDDGGYGLIAFTGDAQRQYQHDDSTGKKLPTWTPDRLLVHVIRDVTLRTRTMGASLQTIKVQTMGCFFSRPLEHIVARLVNFWQTSQPPYLRHLSLIRDTAQVGKTTYYVHYAHRMFELKVKRGEVAWEAVMPIHPIRADEETDSPGFALLDTAQFQGIGHNSTLPECIEAVRAINDKRKAVKKRLLPKKPPILDPASEAARHSFIDSLSSNQFQGNNRAAGGLLEVPQFPSRTRGRPRKYPTESSISEATHLSQKQLSAMRISQKRALDYQRKKAKKEIDRRVSIGILESEAEAKVLSEQGLSLNDYHGIQTAPSERLGRHTTKRKTERLPSQYSTPSAGNLITNHTPASLAKIALESSHSQALASTNSLESSLFKDDQSSAVSMPVEHASSNFPIVGTAHNITGVRQDLADPNSTTPESRNIPLIARPKRKITTIAKFEPSENAKRRISSSRPTRTSKGFVHRAEQSGAIARPGYGAYFGLTTTFKYATSRGRPRKSRMAIFKLRRLRALPWFTNSDENLEGNADRCTSENGPREYSMEPTTISPNTVTVSQSEHARPLDSSPTDLMQPHHFYKTLNGHQVPHSSEPRLTGTDFAELAEPIPPRNQHLSSLEEHTPHLGPITKELEPIEQGLIEADLRDYSNTPETRPIFKGGDLLKGSNDGSLVFGDHETAVGTFRAPVGHAVAVEQLSRTPRSQSPSGHKICSCTLQDKGLTASVPPTEFPNSSIQGVRRSAFRHLTESSEEARSSHEPGISLSNARSDEERQGDGSAEIQANSMPDIPADALCSVEPSPTSERSPLVKQTVSSKAQSDPKGTHKVYSFGSTTLFRRKIIMDIVEASGGVFPGDRELWYPFTTIWLRRFPGPKPDQRTIKNSKNSLINEGKLREKIFTFKDAHGVFITKSVITLPSISQGDSKVKNLEAQIESKYPAYFFPISTDVDRELISANSERNEPSRNLARAKAYVNGLPVATESVVAHFPLSQNKKNPADTIESPALTTPTKRRGRRRAGETPSGLEFGHNLEIEGELRELLDSSKPSEEWEKFAGYFIVSPTAKTHPSTSTVSQVYPSLTATNTIEQLEIENDMTRAVELAKLGSVHSKSISSYAQSPSLPRIFNFVPIDAGQVLPPFVTLNNETLVPPPKEGLLLQNDILVRLPSSYNQFENPSDVFDSLVSNVLLWEMKNPYRLRTESHSTFVHYPFQGKHELAKYRWRRSGSDRHGRSSASVRLASPKSNSAENNRDSILDNSMKDPPPTSQKRERSAADQTVDGHARKRRKLGKPNPHVSRLDLLADKEEPAPGILLSTKPSEKSVKKPSSRGPRTSTVFEAKDDRDLLLAVVIVRVLLGGITQEYNWAIISEMLDLRFGKELLRKRWPVLRSRFRADVDLGESEFRRIFLQAYETNQVPMLNYSRVWEYDWRWLHGWSMEQLEHPVSTSVELPSRRRSFHEAYAFKDRQILERVDLFEVKNSSTITQRRTLIHNSPRLLPQASRKDQVVKDDQMVIVRSWVRANVITPASTYNPREARSKLLSLGQEIVDKAVNQLLSTKVISQENKGRALPGRTYDISQYFLSSFQRNLKVAHFKHAVMFKKWLDANLKGSDQVLFKVTAGDGDMIALLNLLSQDMIELCPKNLPSRKFGLTRQGYRTRQMDKAVLDFDVWIKPTDTYEEGLPLLPLPSPPRMPLTQVTEYATTSKVPTWIDINGDCVLLLWHYALAAVIGSLVINSASNSGDLERVLKSQIAKFEIELVLDWLVQAGAAKWADNTCDTVQLGVWWWTVIAE